MNQFFFRTSRLLSVVTFLAGLVFLDQLLYLNLLHDFFWNVGMPYHNNDFGFPAIALLSMLLAFNWLLFGRLTLWIKKQ
jgi:hypothetical protein